MSSVTRSFDCVMCFCAQYSIAVLQACCHNLSWNGDIEKLFHHSSRWNGPLPMIRSRNERKNGKRDILNFVHTHTHHIHNGVEFPLRLTWQRDSILLKVFFSLLFCTYRPFVRGLCALQTITSNTITLAIQFDSNSLKLNGFNIYIWIELEQVAVELWFCSLSFCTSKSYQLFRRICQSCLLHFHLNFIPFDCYFLFIHFCCNRKLYRQIIVRFMKVIFHMK